MAALENKSQETGGGSTYQLGKAISTADGSEIRPSQVEGKVVYPIIYRVFIHPRLLFGISSTNSMWKNTLNILNVTFQGFIVNKQFFSYSRLK